MQLMYCSSGWQQITSSLSLLPKKASMMGKKHRTMPWFCMTSEGVQQSFVSVLVALCCAVQKGLLCTLVLFCWGAFIKVAFDVSAHVNFLNFLIHMRRNPYKDSILKRNSGFSGPDYLSLFGWEITKLMGWHLKMEDTLENERYIWK